VILVTVIIFNTIMRYQAGIQILLVIISMVIIFTVVKQKFTDIQVSQDATIKYQEALTKATEYNNKLQTLLNKITNMPRSDVLALDRYIPETVDSTKVSRDIKNIVSNAGLLLVEIKANDEEEVSVSEKSPATTNVGSAVNDGFVRDSKLQTDIRNDLRTRRFVVKATGGYEQLKVALGDIERNAYPLRIVSLSLETIDNSALYNYSIELDAYALTSK